MDMYCRCNYLDTYIWNCDESGVLVGRNGRGRILARRGIWSMHTTTPYEKEWLFVLSCINILGSSIPGLYILEGRSFSHNYVMKYKERASMTMHKKRLDVGNIVQQVA